MTHKNRMFLRTGAFLTALFFVGIVSAKAVDAGEEASPRNYSFAPGCEDLELVSFFEIFHRERVIGGLATYGDPATKRRVDCLPLYEAGGRVVMFGWFDRFGVERVAADRGFLEGKNELEGNLSCLLMEIRSKRPVCMPAMTTVR